MDWKCQIDLVDPRFSSATNRGPVSPPPTSETSSTPKTSRWSKSTSEPRQRPTTPTQSEDLSNTCKTETRPKQDRNKTETRIFSLRNSHTATKVTKKLDETRAFHAFYNLTMRTITYPLEVSKIVFPRFPTFFEKSSNPGSQSHQNLETRTAECCKTSTHSKRQSSVDYALQAIYSSVLNMNPLYDRFTELLVSLWPFSIWYGLFRFISGCLGLLCISFSGGCSCSLEIFCPKVPALSFSWGIIAHQKIMCQSALQFSGLRWMSLHRWHLEKQTKELLHRASPPHQPLCQPTEGIFADRLNAGRY